jgi:glucosamine--fructose-6-phosphate aminotransferase (isomerizing)
MYATIRREPQDLRDILARGWQPVEDAAEAITRSRHVFTVGTGTSWHAALHAQYQLRLAGSDATVFSSFDFDTYPPELHPDDAVLVFAHTGTTGYSGRAIERAQAAGAATIVITGLESKLESDGLVLRTVAAEQAAAYTASHTAAVFVAGQIAFVAGRRSNRFGDELHRRFEDVPGMLEAVLERESEVEAMAREGLDRRVFCAGGGPDGALALEMSLKAREAAYTTIFSMETEQFLHGPMVTVNPGDMAVLFATDPNGRERTGDLLSVLDGVGLRAWVIGGLAGAGSNVARFRLPDLHPLLAPVVALAPVQLYACLQAALKGTNPDSFRLDNPVYKAAFDRVKF